MNTRGLSIAGSLMLQMRTAFSGPRCSEQLAIELCNPFQHDRLELILQDHDAAMARRLGLEL